MLCIQNHTQLEIKDPWNEKKNKIRFFQRSVLCLEYHNNRTWQELWQTDYTVSIKIIIIIQIWV